MGALDTPQWEAPEHVTGIAAVGRGGVIGVRGDVPWRIPEDWRRFKQVTMGGALIMGRVTFESIGKPLPGRLSIVISRNVGRGSYEYGDGSSGLVFLDSDVERLGQTNRPQVAGNDLVTGDGSSGPPTNATIQEIQARGTVPTPAYQEKPPAHPKPPPTPQVIHVNSIQDALTTAKRSKLNTFVAGGAQIYRLAWPYLTDLDITEVDQAPQGDTFFPKIDPAEWAEISREPHDGFAFVHYARRAR